LRSIVENTDGEQLELAPNLQPTGRGTDPIADGLRIVGKLKGPVDWQMRADTSFLPPDLQAKIH
jgi:hypothetical protein